MLKSTMVCAAPMHALWVNHVVCEMLLFCVRFCEHRIYHLKRSSSSRPSPAPPPFFISKGGPHKQHQGSGILGVGGGPHPIGFQVHILSFEPSCSCSRVFMHSCWPLACLHERRWRWKSLFVYLNLTWTQRQHHKNMGRWRGQTRSGMQYTFTLFKKWNGHLFSIFISVCLLVELTIRALTR
jgi:hypothetical protein